MRSKKHLQKTVSICHVTNKHNQATLVNTNNFALIQTSHFMKTLYPIDGEQYEAESRLRGES